MHIARLDVHNVRSIARASLEPAAGINVIVGDNGSGKTSVLEAIHVLGYGRSFRGRIRDGLIRSGEAAIEVFAEYQTERSPQRRRVGLRHGGQAWEGRLDGETVSQLGQLCAALAVVTFEPGSHALVTGSGEPRRRYMDWGLFHVEHEFMPLWRRYARALKQRNVLLKRGTQGNEMEPWEIELADSGEAITQLRERYLASLTTLMSPLMTDLAPRLGGTQFEFKAGWRREDMSLRDALLLARDRDLQMGFTSVGAHRGDWSLRHAAMPNDETLSRGQAKMTALCCVLAQAQHHAERRGEWPVMLLDDLGSELDLEHQRRVVEKLNLQPAQVFVTGTALPVCIKPLPHALFHVEQGQVTSCEGHP